MQNVLVRSRLVYCRSCVVSVFLGQCKLTALKQFTCNLLVAYDQKVCAVSTLQALLQHNLKELVSFHKK
jgi:hypothetical protein